MIDPPFFERSLLHSEKRIMRIGTGSLGGKARGLVSVSEILEKRFSGGEFSALQVDIPRMVVLSTDVFTSFMDRNELWRFAREENDDNRVIMAFKKASLPAEIVGDIRAIAEEVQIPMAVRSSSLLEDAMYRPFAGVYATKMIPNNSPSRDERFAQITEAVKFVYASTYFSGAKEYRRTIEGSPDDERMAVILQEVLGKRMGDRYYPMVSGVLRSHNFYPTGHSKPEEGVCSLALGLGKTIVEGESSWSFSPAYPKAPPPFNNMGDLMKYTQTKFWAIQMGMNTDYDPLGEDEFMTRGDLSDAEFDNTLRFVASTYDVRSDRLQPGVAKKGPRVLNFAPLFYVGELNFEDLLKDLLAVGEEKMGSAVEIEFAMNLDPDRGIPANLGFLQIRPMVVSHEKVELEEGDMEGDEVLLASEQTLGNGRFDEIHDIVYIPPGAFKPEETKDIAKELGLINEKLTEQKRPYLLIGFGRWGTSDPWCGIPVLWGQIGGAKAIVEAALPNMDAGMSQGSHFFHNVTSFQVFYFSLPAGSRETIDWEWLGHQHEETRTPHVRHVRCDEPIHVSVDGRTGRGVIRRHG